MYTLTAFFDFTTTASCGGSPIIVTSVGNGCNTALSDNVGETTCSAYNENTQYIMQETSCSTTSMDLSNYTRNYVVKSIFVQSDQCQGDPLQSFALAADSMCHYNPSGTNGSNYFKTNCNGNQPIWSDCTDSNCVNCNTVTYSSSPCQLVAASSSNMVSCFTATKLPTTSSSAPNATISTMTIPIDNGPNSSSMQHFSSSNHVIIWIIFLYTLFRILQ
jgi:hypothetical protein